MRIPAFLTLTALTGVAAALVSAGCSASTTSPGREATSTAGGTSTNGGGTNGNATNTTGQIVVTTGSINMDTTSTTGGTGDSCQMLEVEFTPDTPTVFILVDRSTSMWDNMFWDPLRDGVLEVVQRLHTEVRFGFGTFTGAGTSCPLDLQDVGIIDKNNYDAIANFYMQIGHPNVATETPTAAGLHRAREILEADNAVFPGPKFILLVTDGNPDYCDNGQVECRTDTTVRVLQDNFAAGIHTFVVGLPDPGINQQWLTAFANAGAGEAVSAPQDTTYCSPIPAATATVLPNLTPTTWPQGTYGTVMGPLSPYNVDPAQKDQLVAEITAVLAGVKSCVFDLTDASGMAAIEVAEGKEAEGTVLIKTATAPDGVEQPFDPANGWRVNHAAAGSGMSDQIELVGAACDLLRHPDTTGVEFGFPCEILIEIPK